MKRLLVLVPFFISALMVSPVYAGDPPTSISVSNITVFRNLAETGDKLFVFRTAMPYDSDNWSLTPASESIMFRLYDEDGVTEKDTGAPYVFPYFGSNGYGDGIGSFYFSSTDNGTDWEDEAIINVFGSSDFFTPQQDVNFPLTTEDYVIETTQAANRDLLKAYIFIECDRLTALYTDSGVILKSSSDVGEILSANGETYFRGVIPGLQNLCPELFFIQTLVPETMAVVEYDMSLMDTYTDRLATDDLGKGFTRLGEFVGVGGSFAAGAICFALTLFLSIWASKKGWGSEIGMLGGALIGVALMLLVGDVVFTLVMIVSLLAAMGLVWQFILKKA